MQWKEEGLVDWSGQLDDVRDKLAAADMVVLPSYREGTPRSLLEAMAVGRPLVTTDVPGLPQCGSTLRQRILGRFARPCDACRCDGEVD